MHVTRILYAKIFPFLLKIVHLLHCSFSTVRSRSDSLYWSTGRSIYGRLPTSPYSTCYSWLSLVVSRTMFPTINTLIQFREGIRPRGPINTRNISHIKHIYPNCPTWLTAAQRRRVRMTHRSPAYVARRGSSASTVDCSRRVPSSSQRRIRVDPVRAHCGRATNARGMFERRRVARFGGLRSLF